MMRMVSIRPVEQPEFRVRDKVTRADGPPQGIPEKLLGVREGTNRAEIREGDSVVRCHPVRWAHHPEPPALDIY